MASLFLLQEMAPGRISFHSGTVFLNCGSWSGLFHPIFFLRGVRGWWEGAGRMGDGGVPHPAGVGLAALHGCSGRTVRGWWLFVGGLLVRRNWGELMGMVVFKLGRSRL